MVGKIVVSLVSLILLVGVIVGVVVVVNKNGDSKEDESTKVQMKKVHEFCQATEFKDQCAKSLESVAKNESATVNDYLMAAFQTTLDEVKKGLDEAGKTNVDKEADPYNHMAVDDCKQLLQSAIEELEGALSLVGETDAESIHEYTLDLLNWIGGVYAYQSICLDAIEKPEYKSAIEKGLVNATQLTNNAISIVAKMSDVLKSFNIQIPEGFLDGNSNSSPHRRLLDANKVDQDGYPTWFPAADRKLLEKSSKGKGKGKGKGGAAPGGGPPLPPVGSGPLTPHAIVAKDGSGKFKTVLEAIKAYPVNHQGRYIVYVKAGVYVEQVTIDKKQPNVFMYGDGAGKTIISCDKNYGKMRITTMNTATVGVNSEGFIAKGITFRNTAGPDGEQAVALRISGDRGAVFDCSIEGNQDTLYYQTFRQFYRNCVVSGTIDFIFGMGSAVIQNSEIILRRPRSTSKNTITADGRDVEGQITGVVLQNCKIVAEQSLFADRFKYEHYLTRPWKKFSTNVFMESEIGDLIRPEGYLIWASDKPNFFEQTCEVYEYANRGPGANTNGRSKLFKKFKVLSPQEATKYTVGTFLQANAWLPGTSAPFYLGLGGK
ncbi:pectinesterase [Solanum tuberosum]|uniref:Pectinesterase n=1 Tax=Solanum tuberosum TaxID=4113 RepID=M1A2Q2_SOLTU|nr:PREDICTED: pectinesterase [Solanum tuberosum]